MSLYNWTFLIFCSCSDIAAEKSKEALKKGIEEFNPSNLKKTDTQEKNPLPSQEGEWWT